MQKPEAWRLLLATLAVSWLLTACHDSAPDAPAKPAAAGGNSKAPKTSELGVDMIAAVAPESSSAVIGMYFALTKAPVINEGFPLDIVIVPHREFSSVSVHFFSQNGLTLVSGDSTVPLPDAKPEKAIKHQLVLMPAQEGLYMISATVETTGVDGTVSRMFSIPVVVTSPDAAPPAATPSAKPTTPAAS